MSHMPLTDQIVAIRRHRPERIAQILARRPRGVLPGADVKLLILACDHPARGALAAGSNDMAMASREDLLARCVEALSRPGVHGFLGTADLIEDLAILGVLDGKLVYGSMNRGGLAGARFEMWAAQAPTPGSSCRPFLRWSASWRPPPSPPSSWAEPWTAMPMPLAIAGVALSNFPPSRAWLSAGPSCSLPTTTSPGPSITP